MTVNFSVVVTVLNEEKSVLPLLNSLINQTVLPKEIVIVDSGSTDETLRLIYDWREKKKTSIVKIIKKLGVNRSKGRNLGIIEAKCDWIAITDAGCEVDKNWLKQLGKSIAINNQVEVVAGYYLPVTDSPWQRCFSLYTCVIPDKYDEKKYLPSSRSVAFTKKAWKKAGRYPEQLDTCEDLVFASKLKETSKLVANRKALVYWHQERGLREFYQQIKGYAEGDAKAKYWNHVLKIVTVFARYSLFFIYPPFFLMYLFYAPVKFWKWTYKDGSFFLLPVVQIVADMAVISGTVKGFMSSQR